MLPTAKSRPGRDSLSRVHDAESNMKAEVSFVRQQGFMDASPEACGYIE